MPPSEIRFDRPARDTLQITLAGAWNMRAGLPSLAAVEHEVDAAEKPRRVVFDSGALSEWDTALVTFLLKVANLCAARGIDADREGLPTGVQRLLALTEAVPEKTDTKPVSTPESFLARVGVTTVAGADGAVEFIRFLGQMTIAFAALLRGRARFRRSDLFLFVQQAGADALPIITLISFLVGVIMAFVGAVQLEKFGAAIYVADLVGIAVVREMGAMMTGIVMAGRTGAAFAAQLGTMKVTQEIDALTTMGISPLEFLVLPRALALCLPVYLRELTHAVGIGDLLGGIFKASVYGVLIALAGCLRGMQAGNSAAAVGDAATSAVVTGIVLIVSACGLFAVVFYVLGI
jgi:phospholipid/cholesterol/gamma-HCH transport system permease protein